MRLVREAIANEENAPKGDDLEAFMDAEGEDDKTYAAMGVAKTLSTVSDDKYLKVTCIVILYRLCHQLILRRRFSRKCRKSSSLLSGSP